MVWVVWSCIDCHRVRYTVQWWAEKRNPHDRGCDHGNYVQVSGTGVPRSLPGETPLPAWARAALPARAAA
jgi:hypothetical protein